MAAALAKKVEQLGARHAGGDICAAHCRKDVDAGMCDRLDHKDACDGERESRRRGLWACAGVAPDARAPRRRR